MAAHEDRIVAFDRQVEQAHAPILAVLHADRRALRLNGPLVGGREQKLVPQGIVGATGKRVQPPLFVPESRLARVQVAIGN